MGTVLNEIHDARTKWYYIGIELKLDVSTLKAIESKYSDCKDCLREVITKWLKAVQPKPTWRSLVDALRRPVVDESKLAAVLESKYCPERRGNYTLLSMGIYSSCNVNHCKKYVILTIAFVIRIATVHVTWFFFRDDVPCSWQLSMGSAMHLEYSNN